MRDSNCWDVDSHAEMHSEARMPGMVGTSRVDEHHVGSEPQAGNRGCQDGTLPSSEESRYVRCRHSLGCDRLGKDVVGAPRDLVVARAS